MSYDKDYSDIKASLLTKRSVDGKERTVAFAPELGMPYGRDVFDTTAISDTERRFFVIDNPRMNPDIYSALTGSLKLNFNFEVSPAFDRLADELKKAASAMRAFAPIVDGINQAHSFPSKKFDPTALPGARRFGKRWNAPGGIKK